jgi:hypothetical protein
MLRPGTHTDQRCPECQKANPIIRPFCEPKIWYCAVCSSVLCKHTAVVPTSYGNAWCPFDDPKAKAKRKHGYAAPEYPKDGLCTICNKRRDDPLHSEG